MRPGGGRSRRTVARWTRGLGYALGVVVLSGCWVAPPPPNPALFDVHITRAPYLTDLVGTHALVNWATDRSQTTGSLQWGPVAGDGSCSLTTTQTATKAGVTVNNVSEYQWKAPLSLPAPGPYCYRVYLGTTDLLGGATSPQFQTQAQPGSTDSFAFGVIGDWGQVDSTGANPDQANLMQRIASSGVRFVATVGDNGYPAGSQTNYGDLQQRGADISAIFGPSFWAVPGSQTAIFPIPGNHGLTSGTSHADLVNWPQDQAVSTSGGRYQGDTYCCVNGTSSANYSSAWYAFDAGPARFYMLTAAWGDSNPGTATPYANDYATRWTASSPEYQWLQADLQAHPSGLKFAFFHYPMYSDNTTESSDTFLQGSSSLEGLLNQNGVDIAFNGHAHMYERNTPNGPGGLINYVTGGGGATLEPIGPTCRSWDAYGIGWSPTTLTGSACGAAPPPSSASQVFHFLKVTVNGSSVTVEPTTASGQVFDAQTYGFTTRPDTVIDSGPAAVTSATSATFSFHSTVTPATFSCTLDGAGASPCTSPVTYNGLATGSHTSTVAAAAASGTDPTPATSTWTVDTAPPSTPTGVAASALGPNTVGVSWSASSDNTGVTGYDVARDGTTIGSAAGMTTSLVDPTASPATSYQYTVRARDGADNASPFSTPPASVTTPAAASPVFSDGFESGGLTSWTTKGGLTVESTTVHSGSFAAEGNTANGATYAKKTLPATYPDGYARIYFDVKSASSQVNLLRFRTSSGTSLGSVFVTSSAQVGLHNDVAGTNTNSSTVAALNTWHALELHMLPNGTASTIEVWLDGTRVAALSTTAANLGTTPIGQIQIGEVQTGRTYDVAFDDVAFGTQRVGP